MRHTRITLAICLATATAALAHADVSDPTVKARMAAMKAIAGQTKVLGQMAKGETPFDADKAIAAANTITLEAAEIPALFSDPATDPKSEALPAIWDNFSDFSAKSDALMTAAETATTTITDQASLGAALGQIGGTCKACHSEYRMK